MKTLAALFLVCVYVVLTVAILAVAGCATTRVKIATPSGVRVSASFPKDIDAGRVSLSYDPSTGAFLFTADDLRADASTVVREQVGAVKAGAKAAATAAPLLLAP